MDDLQDNWERLDNASKLKRLIAIFSCCTFLILIICISSSIVTLHPLSYGLEQNAITKQLQSEKVWTGGRFWIGISHSLQKFPKQQKSLVFSNFLQSTINNGVYKGYKDNSAKQFNTIDARTSEGAPIDLDISVNWKLITNIDDSKKSAEELKAVYTKWENNYEVQFASMIKHWIIDLAAHFNAYNQFQMRKTIELYMEDEITGQLKSCCGISITDLSIIGVNYPDPFEKAIELTEIEQQKIYKAQYDMEKEKVYQITLVNIPNIKYEITKTVQTIRSDSNIYQQTKVADASLQTIKTDGVIAEEIMKIANFVDQDITISNKLITIKKYDKYMGQLWLDAIVNDNQGVMNLTTPSILRS